MLHLGVGGAGRVWYPQLHVYVAQTLPGCFSAPEALLWAWEMIDGSNTGGEKT